MDLKCFGISKRDVVSFFDKYFFYADVIQLVNFFYNCPRSPLRNRLISIVAELKHDKFKINIVVVGNDDKLHVISFQRCI